MKARRGRAVGRGVVLAFTLAGALLPLLWTVLAALGLEPDGRGWRGTLTLDNLAGVTQYEPAFGTEFAYTLAVTAVATALTIATGFPAAWWLARRHGPAGAGLMQGVLVLAVSPAIAYGLPLAALLHQTRLYDSFAGLVLVMAAAQLPLALWLLRSYLLRIPEALEEAARLDGASGPAVLRRIVLPVAAGGVVATAVLVFVLDWNLFLLPSLVSERPPLVLPLVMRDFFAFERELEWTTAASALVVTLAPVFLLVLAAQRALDKLIFVPQEPSS